jgi:hypothetical protein
MSERTWDERQVITALCLWEATLGLSESGESDKKVGKEPSAHWHTLTRLWDGVGVFTMRAAVADLAEDCDEAFKAAIALGYDDSFDFDFCPEFLRGAIESGRLEKAIDRQFGG